MISFCPSVLHISNGSPLCVVVFSSFALRDYGSMAFSFRKHFDPNQQIVDLIYIKDKNNQWYNRKLEGFGDSLDENIKLLKKKISAYQNIVTFGSSMGGYASLLIGDALGADRIISVSPQTFLEAPFPRFKCKQHSGDYKDLRKLHFDGNKHVDIFLGENCLFDIYQILNYINVPNVSIHLLAKSSHHAIENWVQDGTLTNFVNQICQDSLDQFIQSMDQISHNSIIKDALTDKSFQCTLSESVETYYKKKYGRSIECLMSLLRDLPTWYAARSLLGQAYLRNGNKDLAAAEFSLIFSQDENVDEYLHDYAKLLAENGDSEGALDVAKRGLAINKTHRAIFKTIGGIFKSTKQDSAAKECSKYFV
jgi:tetratricopeptide (TPR) repeat protein